MSGRAGAAVAPSAPASGAQRFAARVRSRRRRRWTAVTAAVLVVVGAVWTLGFSSWLSVREIRVDGLHRVPEASVRLVTDAELGRAMVLVDPTALAGRVVAVPLVHDAVVERRWPNTLLVHVHERVAIAAVPAAVGGLRLVDGDGVEVARGTAADAKAAGLPVLDVNVDQAPKQAVGAATLRAALDVLRALPADLRDQLVSIGATTPDGVWLALSDGVRVAWGDAGAADRKATVLAALLAAQKSGQTSGQASGQKAGQTAGKASGAGVTIDVSSPDAPAVSPR